MLAWKRPISERSSPPRWITRHAETAAASSMRRPVLSEFDMKEFEAGVPGR